MEDYCLDFYDKAHNKFYKFKGLFLTKKEKHVLAVGSFYGEVINGGLLQYMGNESGDFIKWSIEAFYAIGIPNYAKVMENLQDIFPKKKFHKTGEAVWKFIETIDDFVLDPILECIEQPFSRLSCI